MFISFLPKIPALRVIREFFRLPVPPRPAPQKSVKSSLLRVSCRLQRSGWGACALTALVAALFALAGCASVFEQGPHGAEWQAYAAAAVAHNIRNNYGLVLGKEAILADHGIQELPAPGTQVGPSSQPTPGPTTTTASTQPTIATLPPGGRVPISLAKAMDDALGHNLSIKLESFSPRIAQSELIQAEAAFDPIFFGESDWQKQNQPTPYPSTIGGVGPIGYNNQDTFNNDIGLRGLLPTGGTMYLQGTSNYLDVHSSSSLPPDINPSYSNALTLGLSQPLLRGFGPTVTSAKIRIARTNRRIALADFRAGVIKILAQLEETYFSLANATADIRIEQRLIASLQQIRSRLLARQGMDVDAVQISQANSALAQARFTLAGTLRDAHDYSQRLKAQINTPSIPVASTVRMVPSTPLLAVPILFDLRDDIATALHNRPELAHDRAAMARAGIDVQVAENGLLPKLDLVASTSSMGLAPNGSFAGADNRMLNDPHIGYEVGLKLEVPLGNRAAKAELERRRYQRQGALTRLLRDAQNVTRDIVISLWNLAEDWQQLRAARRRRAAAQRVVTGLRVQEQSGQSLTPTFLQLELDAAQNLAAASQAEQAAIARYDVDLVKFQQAKGTLLRFSGVKVSDQ